LERNGKEDGRLGWTERRTVYSRDGWMDDGGKEEFGTTLCSMGMSMNGLMLE